MTDAASRSRPAQAVPADLQVDVLVVGLGPAGASAAASAARDGARVLAIDKRRAPGSPVQCAELVPALIRQVLPDIAVPERQSIRGMRTFIGTAPPHTTEPFPGIMLDRGAFDRALVAAAGAAGARVEAGVALSAMDGDGCARLSTGRRVAARVIIGADGPRSLVGAALGAVNHELAETRQVSVPLLTPSDFTDIYLETRLPGGYAWLFPAGRTANLGLGAVPPARGSFKALLDALHDRLARSGIVGRDVLALTGGAIPSGGITALSGRIGERDVLLAGDAAGLTNPVSGAGINAAVISGRLAGAAAAAHVAGARNAITDYAEEITDTLGGSLRHAVRRRAALLAVHVAGREPSAAELRRGWIAFPEYWVA